MPGQMYAAKFDSIAVTALQDLFELLADTDNVVVVVF